MSVPNMHIFLYYGVVVPKIEAHHLANTNGEADIYDVVFANELNFQKIGRSSYSENVVIGKEMLWDHSKSILTLDVDSLKLSTTDVDDQKNEASLKLSNDEEKIVKGKLRKLGISKEPKYYIISSHGIM